jgi:hypothetical protein
MPVAGGFGRVNQVQADNHAIAFQLLRKLFERGVACEIVQSRFGLEPRVARHALCSGFSEPLEGKGDATVWSQAKAFKRPFNLTAELYAGMIYFSPSCCLANTASLLLG